MVIARIFEELKSASLSRRQKQVGFFALFLLIFPAFFINGAALSQDGQGQAIETQPLSPQEYDKLVLQARDGDSAPALAYLRQLGDRRSLSQQLDYILIASWAGQSDEVVGAYESLPQDAFTPALPVNVKIAVARAFRDLKNWEKSLAIWQQGADENDQDGVRFAPGLIMTLADSGKPQEAEQIGQEWATRYPNDADIRQALIYVYQLRERQAIEAARAEYDRLVRLARAGDSAPALDYLRQLGDGATPAQRFDRILIASWAGNHQEVIAGWQALPDELRRTAPVDVLIAVARSLRDMKRWPEALALWREGLAAYPQDGVRFAPGLVMTLVDNGQFDEAIGSGLEFVARFGEQDELNEAIDYAYRLQGRVRPAVLTRVNVDTNARAVVPAVAVVATNENKPPLDKNELSLNKDEYDNLISRARGGDRAPALAYLRQLGRKATPLQSFDHMLIASWDGKLDEVLAVYQRLPADAVALPANVVVVVARALRGQQRFAPALQLWQEGLKRYPNEANLFAAGQVLALADLGRVDEAIKTGLNWLKRLPFDAELHMALAYAYTLQEKHFEALFHADKALKLAPQTIWIEDEYIRVLNRAGMSDQALDRARQVGAGRFSGRALRGLEADEVARRTRLAAMPTRSEAERFVIADRALARYDELLRAWRALGQEAAADVTRIRIDRLAAFHARVRMDDLVREYEALLREGVTIPVWALSNVASAYLYLRQPEIARDLYRVVLADLEAKTPVADRDKLGPKNARLGNEIGLMYALSEAEQFREMKPVLKRIEAYTPVFLYHKGSALPDGNLEYLSSRQALIAADLAMDNTPAAQRKLEELVREAPNNTDLITDLASVTRVRAQPRRAEQYYKLAETLEPRDSDLEIGQALVALDLQEWRQVEELNQDVISRYPENRTAQRLNRLWQVHNMAEFRISSSHSLANRVGDQVPVTTISDSGDFGIDSVLYSRPQQYNWRVFAGVGHSQGKFAEGRGRYSYLRGGLEWRSRDVQLEAEITANRYGHGVKGGARLSGSYDINDHWQVSGSLDYLSRQTPVRALREGIQSHSAQLGVRWRGNERREWVATLARTHFTDGNDRWALGVNGVERLYTTPNMQLDMLFSASIQRNDSDADRPYFNPKRDLMILPALRATHRLYRRYENVWEHFLTLSAGKYNQEDYDSSGVWGVAYGQRYRHNDVFEIGATLDGLSRTYDGRREEQWRLFLDLMARF